MEVNEMPNAHKSSEYGRNNDYLEQILRHPISDPKENLLDELTTCAIDEAPCDENLSRIDTLAASLEGYSPIEEVSQADVECRLEMLHSQHPELSADRIPAVSAAANTNNQKTKRGEIDADHRDESPCQHLRKTRKLLILAAVLIVLFSAVSVTAFGNTFFRTFAQWTSQIFHMGTSQSATIGYNDLAVGESRTYDTPEEMLADFGIQGQLLPTWLPEGFVLYECKAERMIPGLRLKAKYSNGDSYIMLHYVQTCKKDELDVEKDSVTVSLKNWGGIRHYVISDINSEKVVWTNGDFESRVAGNISIKELQKVVASHDWQPLYFRLCAFQSYAGCLPRHLHRRKRRKN